MKAVSLEKPGVLRVVEKPRASLKEHEIRIKVER
jgi:NADPH:quinone reductase-like Zn-dependent oxidoreductase